MTPSDPVTGGVTPGSVEPALLRRQAVGRARALLLSLPLPAGTALAATGSLARGEMTPYSDLDLILLHPAGAEPSAGELDALWYPIWDKKFRLNHAVRTPAECEAMISADSTAALALLELTHLAGSEALTASTRQLVLRSWRSEISRNFDALAETAIARWNRSGSVVSMTHPDLKHGRGGLRDIALLKALALGNLADVPDLGAEHELLLDVRTLLHQGARRSRDVLDPEFAADLAGDLGFSDRYALAAALADAARTIDDAVNRAMGIARGVVTRGALGTVSRRQPGLSNTRTPGLRRPLDVDVVAVGEYITLSRDPDLSDPGLLLRVSSAAARTGLPVASSVWKALRELPPLPPKWMKVMVDDFIATLSSPEHTQRVVNTMDREGLWIRIVPWWEHIRGRLPRERSHINTIDQHSLVTVAHCASASVTVARPDLLLLAALFHDLGKGYGQPHEQVGAGFVARIASDMEFNHRDRVCLQTLVAEHTTIAKLAARRDPYAEDTLDDLLTALNYDLLTVNLLGVLTEADAKATGPGVWNRQLSSGLEVLLRRARHRLHDLQPRKPIVFSGSEIGLREVAGDPGAGVVNWRGDYLRGSIRALAAIAAKSWNIEGVRLAQREDGTWHGLFEVRSLVSMQLDAEGFVQAYRSGVHSTLPLVVPGATALFWTGRILEVRTHDRLGTIGALISVLPEVTWLTSQKLGATMLVQCALSGHFDRAKVERDVTRLLATG
ncbi:[protein-PII] uridylyltransferase [Corynebacterium sp. A21]|uniref:[protein-PII] uridylyltransferase n=1 Tax=Corynebacterium sp. A21 TaxID=3457318 RepID=UPI003FD50A3A